MWPSARGPIAESCQGQASTTPSVVQLGHHMVVAAGNGAAHPDMHQCGQRPSSHLDRKEPPCDDDKQRSC